MNMPVMPDFPKGKPPFIDLLSSHEPFIPHWEDPRKAADDELDVRGGLSLQFDFPDPEKLLETAVCDLNRALNDLKLKGGKFPIRLMKNTALENEDFTLAVNADGITIHAGNT